LKLKLFRNLENKSIIFFKKIIIFLYNIKNIMGDLSVYLTQGDSSFEFMVSSPMVFASKPTHLEAIIVLSRRSLDIVQKKIMVKFVQTLENKFSLEETKMTLDATDGLQVGLKYVIKLNLFSASVKLAVSSKIIATVAALPSQAKILGVKNLELGKTELTLDLGPWQGAPITVARILLFKDKQADEEDEITTADVPMTAVDSWYDETKQYTFALPNSMVDGFNEYLVKVALISSIGIGPFSEVKRFQSRNVPDCPLALKLIHSHLDNTVVAEWKQGEDARQYPPSDLSQDLKVLFKPWEGSEEQVLFYSRDGILPKREEASVSTGEKPIDMHVLNQLTIPLQTLSAFLHDLSNKFPDKQLSRKQEFECRMTTSDGINESLPAVSNVIHILRAYGNVGVLAANAFRVGVSGQQTIRHDGEVDRVVTVRATLKEAYTFAALKQLLTERSNQWATGVEYEVALTQDDGECKMVAFGSITFDETTDRTSITSLPAKEFSTSDKLDICFWLIDEAGNKSSSFQFPEELPLKVSAVASHIAPFKVEPGAIITTLVYVFKGTKSSTLAATLSTRPTSDLSFNLFPFVPSLPLLLVATGQPDEYKVSYPFQVIQSSSQKVDIKLSVDETDAGVSSQIYSDAEPSQLVVSETDLGEVVMNFNAFDRTPEPESPSDYQVLVFIEKAVIIRKLQILNNIQITRVIKLQVSASSNMLTFQDEEDEENTLEVAFSMLSSCVGISVPSQSDQQLLDDLTMRNLASLKDSYIFCYLDISDLQPSKLSIKTQVIRYILGQQYMAEKITQVILKDVASFGVASENFDYSEDKRKVAILINTHGNDEDTMVISLLALAASGTDNSIPQFRTCNLLSSDLIQRGSETWALIPYGDDSDGRHTNIGAFLTILYNLGITSNQIKFSILAQQGSGAIIAELEEIQAGLATPPAAHLGGLTFTSAQGLTFQQSI
jgi:hypothetical protein